jgi:hypothetical protein
MAYRRDDSKQVRVVDRWDGPLGGGFGWQAHPGERGGRTSHAIACEDGVWLLDPLDAPGLDEHVADLGEVAGVAVCSDYHARDAGVLARRHDVPVTVPSWLSRVESRVDAPVERVTGSVAGFETRRLRPLRAWRETILYRQRDGTLYTPDFLSTHPKFTAGAERLGMPTFSRLSPPRETLGAFTPERILCGHGPALFADAAATLETTLAEAHRRFPRALVENLPGELRVMLAALRD